MHLELEEKLDMVEREINISLDMLHKEYLSMKKNKSNEQIKTLMREYGLSYEETLLLVEDMYSKIFTIVFEREYIC